MSGRVDYVGSDGNSLNARVASLDVASSGGLVGLVERLIALSQRALPHMYRVPERTAVQTARRDPAAPGGLRPEGVNLRYTAILALGAAQLGESDQRTLLSGSTAAELAAGLVDRGVAAPDLGGSALAGWAAAEVAGTVPGPLFDRIVRDIRQATPQPTVDYAWALTALVAAERIAPGEFSLVAGQAVERLLAAQGARGIFPHALPRQILGRYRAHVGCYADQVYPIQALARYFANAGDARALDAANACAARIVELQGPAGQWWWHYDVRNGDVVEGYPVYSVHQHAMGPMALFDLFEAGGADHRPAIADGLDWLNTHPEISTSLVDEQTGAVWRKVGRRERRKAVRSMRAVSTALSPGRRLDVLDRIFPPGAIDYECRPYEQGWLLYAWLSGSQVVAGPRAYHADPGAELTPPQRVGPPISPGPDTAHIAAE